MVIPVDFALDDPLRPPRSSIESQNFNAQLDSRFSKEGNQDCELSLTLSILRLIELTISEFAATQIDPSINLNLDFRQSRAYLPTCSSDRDCYGRCVALEGFKGRDGRWQALHRGIKGEFEQ